MQRKNKGFTLIELLIVISIMSIVSVMGISNFYSFLNSLELNDKVYVINRDLKDFDRNVKSYEIPDYECHIKEKGLLYYCYTDYIDNNKQEITFSNNYLTGVIENTLSDRLHLNIESDNLPINKNIDLGSFFTGSFANSVSYNISGISLGKYLNNIIVRYFGEENLGLNKNENNLLQLDKINTKEDKSGENITELIIKNTGKGRELYKQDGTTKINEAYLFFSKQGEEEKLEIN